MFVKLTSSQISRLGQRVPPHAYFVGSAIFHYLGPSFAVLLFARLDVLGVAWLRIASAALIFAIWRRPWRLFLAANRRDQALIVALGAVFALMNTCFYLAIDRLPLATVAAIEFIGPISLALIGARILRNFAAAASAALGVYALTHLQFRLEPLGIAFAFANAGLFTAYIVLAHRVARNSALRGIDGLAAAMMFALVFVSPIGLYGAARAFSDPVAIAAGIGVGISSSVIPYVLDQVVMARLPRASYALFVALLPAVATVIGAVILRQIPAPVDVLGIVLVMVGVGMHRTQAASSPIDGHRRRRHSDGTPHRAAHGGQILVSHASRDAITRENLAGVALLDLGEHRLRGLASNESLYQVEVAGLPDDFPPPRTETA